MANLSELRSYGVVVNSFYELEPTYADHYRKELGWKAWHIGPLSLCNRGIEDEAAGVPMVTWPVFAEQFYNEKLVTQVLRIGIGVGVQQWAIVEGDFVKKESIEKAVKEMMIGDRAEEMRGIAKALKEMARRAIENGGSSYSDFNTIIEKLRLKRP
ncbi:hypothetical protein CFOL_v3_34721 [Cephalotus follicularis]|uniref:UDPGT domain-containing protein n=1 Tax=Cephalotus follicularis TaxID=3775 RepID=A0A1Q3DFX5_CEPFO|nr:hypothetical protein CFOL_v3_34721 [Cephalotus follicularis]